jgi:multidrug efflux pump subunit AcrA (membrane-fusion protein)
MKNPILPRYFVVESRVLNYLKNAIIQISEVTVMSNQYKIKLLPLLALASLLLAACSGLSAQTTPTPEPETINDVKPVVNATGKVVPTQYSRLSMTLPGVVDEILVEEGDQVEQDDLLLRLKGEEDLNAAISAANFEITAAQKALDDLYKNSETARTQALDAIALQEKLVRDARYQLDNFTPPQVQAKMSTAEALEWAKQRLDRAYAAFEPYKYYSETDQTRKDRKEDYDDAQADYNAAVKRLQYETELAVTQANLQKAQDDYQTWKDGPDPKDVAVAQARLDNAKAALKAAEAKLEDLELRAPFSGTISEVNVRQGEWINAGQAVLVAANLADLQVETTDLNEIDAARVKVGNPVVVTFDALPGVEVNGTVKSIAPKASEGSGVNYTVVVKLDELPELLRWGMTAFVDIEVGNQ